MCLRKLRPGYSWIVNLYDCTGKLSTTYGTGARQYMVELGRCQLHSEMSHVLLESAQIACISFAWLYAETIRVNH